MLDFESKVLGSIPVWICNMVMLIMQLVSLSLNKFMFLNKFMLDMKQTVLFLYL